MTPNEKNTSYEIFDSKLSQTFEELEPLIKSNICKYLPIGETVSSDMCSEDCQLILLKGKIRVLKTYDTTIERTLSFLEKGSIFNPANFDEIKLVVSSDAEIYEIPESIITENKILKNHLEITKQKIEEADMLCSNPDSQECIKNELDYQYSISSDNTESSELPDIAECFQQILTYYKFPYIKLKDEAKFIENLNQLERKLKELSFQTKKETINWTQLLNTVYPFILQDDKGHLRWITGKKGNTLLEEKNGINQRYIPEMKSIGNEFVILRVEPYNQKKNSSIQEPFSISWYFKLFSQNWILTSQMIFSSILVQLFTLGMPIFYMVIFDRVFGRQNLSALNIIAIGLILIMSFDLCVKSLRSYVLSHLLESVDKVSTETFLQKVFNLPISTSNRDEIKGFLDKFGDLVKINQSITSTILISSLDVIFSVIVVLALLALHWQLALISFAPLIPVAIVTFWLAPIQKKRAIQSAQNQRQAQVKLTEALENNETVRSINATQFLFWNILEKAKDTFEKDFNARYDRISSGNILGFFTGLGSFAILYFGAYEVLSGKISFGVYLAISILGRSFIGVIQKLLISLQQFQESLATLQSLKTINSMDIMNQQGSEGVYLNRVTGHISIIDASFRYQPEYPLVLNNVNLEIRPGEKIILTGKSGAGKTTLVRLLQRLWTLSSGIITLDGYNIADIDQVSLRNHIGAALQKPGIFAGTIRDNIVLGNPSASKESILETVSMVQLDKLLVRLPNGLDTPILPLGSNLSGGQVAQIALARVLLINPDILIIDEALSPLDSSLQGSIFTQILEKYKKSTCIFITDYLPVHEQADRIVVLQDGQIVEQGSFKELTSVKGYYYHLHSQNLVFAS